MSSDRRNLVPGKKYELNGEDCCLMFRVPYATFVRYAPDEDEYVFDIISVGPDWGSWTTVELQ